MEKIKGDRVISPPVRAKNTSNSGRNDVYVHIRRGNVLIMIEILIPGFQASTMCREVSTHGPKIIAIIKITLCAVWIYINLVFLFATGILEELIGLAVSLAFLAIK